MHAKDHPGFECQGRYHQKSKTGESLTTQKRSDVFQFFSFKKIPQLRISNHFMNLFMHTLRHTLIFKTLNQLNDVKRMDVLGTGQISKYWATFNFFGKNMMVVKLFVLKLSENFSDWSLSIWFFPRHFSGQYTFFAWKKMGSKVSFQNVYFLLYFMVLEIFQNCPPSKKRKFSVIPSTPNEINLPQDTRGQKSPASRTVNVRCRSMTITCATVSRSSRKVRKDPHNFGTITFQGNRTNRGFNK